ncbi:MAG: hypothetical protein EXS35_17395 [Pedosphaera sp.]|nr:hypothetical protein [Pedosphaera sp.]
MSKEQEIQELAAHFRALGAYDPDGWARSQVEEGIPQYARFVFLRQAWQSIIADGDAAWIDLHIGAAERQPRSPGASIGPALKRMLASGASREDIAEVVRVMQWSALEGMAYQLDDSGVVEYPSEKMPRVNWALFEVDEAGQPLHSIDCLHESVLDTDPTGREMRPKGVTRAG